MTNLNVKFKKILKDLEENVQNKEDLEYVKVQIFNLYNLFFEEMTKLEEMANEKTAVIESRQAKMEEQIENLQNKLKGIENELYIEDDCNFSINCPYCNNEFVLENDELKDEVVCPECSNIIELDWGDECDDDCGHDCSHCHHDEEDEDM